MSRHRHRRQRKSGSIELNVTAMLDMAFQLLAFFILTFRPTPIEGQLAMNLPPPVALTPDKPAETPTQDGAEGEHFETVDLFVSANEQGRVREKIRIGPRAVVQGGFDTGQQGFLRAELKKIFAIKGAFDRVQIVAEGRLVYGDLMKIIEICSQQKLPDGSFLQKISFIEKDAAEGT